MTALADWLLAQIAADEKVAQEATPGRWHADDLYGTVTADPYTSARDAYDRDRFADEDCWVVPESMDSGVGRHNLAHIALHDPVRVLAQCEAHRKIVEWAQHFDMEDSSGLSGDMARGAKFAFRDAARAIAGIYRGRPGWQEDWA